MIDCISDNRPYTIALQADGEARKKSSSGGDMASTWVAKLWVHAEGQITS